MTTRTFFVITLILLLAAPATAQLRDSCDGMENIGNVTLPQTISISAPLTNAFTLTGAGCSEVGVDAVVCVTPTTGCTVSVTCDYNPGTTTMASNFFMGPCAASPGVCEGSASGASPITLPGVLLKTGTPACFVCESLANATSIEMTITETAGSCGSLPVSVKSFEISE